MVFATYVTDDGVSTFQTLVDADQRTDVNRGWLPAVPGSDLMPRGFHERRVYGVSPTTGRKGSARIAATSANLWTGVASEFTVEANDGTIDTMVVTTRRGERRRVSH